MLVNLSNFFSYCHFSCRGTSRKQIAFGRFHKDLFSRFSELSKCGEGEGISAVKAWDVFRMLERFKRTLFSNLAYMRHWMKTRAFDKFEEMDLEITE